MKAVIQRVSNATLSVDGKTVAEIGKGLVVYLGIYSGDGPEEVDRLCKKVCAMRIFSDAAGKMNLSVRDVGGSVLLVSNFTLCADISRGNRPDFFGAMKPAEARELFEKCAAAFSAVVPTAVGVFGADMTIAQSNDGPVTIVY